MGDNALVSVLITTFDRPEMLERAINKCQAQSYENVEILVVDHSGREYAREIVEDYESVDYIGTSEELGQIGAWNEGFKRISGEYVQFHDDDDWLKPSKIEKQVDLISGCEDIGIAYCGIVTDSGEVLRPEKGNKGTVIEPVLEQKFKRCQTTTMLIKSDLLEDIMPLKEFGNAGDLALQIELCQETKFDYLNEALVHRLMSHESSGDSLLNRRTRLELIEYYSHIYEEYPDTKRRTLQEINKMLGLKLLDENMWSLEAVKNFYNVLQYRNEFNIKDFTRFISSFFGKTGLKFVELVYKYSFSNFESDKGKITDN